MDDSVIKVLRRNGSWEKTNNKNDSKTGPSKDPSNFKSFEEDFRLDEKFEVLAKEIKKRMNRRGSKSNQLTKIDNNDKLVENKEYSSRKSFEDIGVIKSQILPYLKTIEKLVIEKQNHLDNIAKVDKKLDFIYEDILKIKNNYLETINKLKNNINFFDDSLNIIKSAKEEK